MAEHHTMKTTAAPKRPVRKPVARKTVQAA